MRLKSICLAVALATATLSPAVAMAQQSQRAAPAAPTARQLELTRQYIGLMMTDQFESAIREMITDEAASEASFQDLPDADRRFIVDLTAELTAQMVPQMIDEMVPVYAAAFSEEELEALVAFYGSEMGRSIARKNVEVMPEANRAVMSVVPLIINKMAARMCQHYGCTPEELEELQAMMREETGAAPATAQAPSRK